jgi:maltokinase
VIEAFPPELVERLPAHLAAQRWYAGSGSPGALELSLCRRLWSDGAERELWQLVVGAGDDRYHLVLALRPDGEPADFLNGHDPAVLGSARGVYAYDALWDPELSRVLLLVASGGRERAERARPVGVEQSNSSIVFDERLILKVFRHLRSGPNPEVEVTAALAGAGFEHVAEPMVHWREGDLDLAFGQRYLAGGAEGWALALASLRDLYASGADQAPSEAGGDFSPEAGRLGRLTAELHVAMASVFARADPEGARRSWAALLEGVAARLERAGRRAGRDLGPAGEATLGRLRAVQDPGPAIRVHGDFHLGQVMRTDRGWYVLDFEGEPARPVAERVAPASPFKDVTGMLRSFHYASRHALVQQAAADRPAVEPAARAWEAHNRQAFLDGYLAHPGIGRLLPDPSAAAAVMAGYELDKALYELEYELVHRPDWVAIPLDALERLLEGGDEVG